MTAGRATDWRRYRLVGRAGSRPGGQLCSPQNGEITAGLFQWYVLVEANSNYGSDSYGELKKKHHVEGDRSAALSHAEEICRTWCPSQWEPEKSGRTVFQTSETSWLVEVTDEWWSEYSGAIRTSEGHFRVTVARLVHAKETPPAHPPEKKAGVIRRAFGGGR
ncbi:hypothetical protein ACIQWL_51535 [Streptomyces mirabilis]|uniref:hypothetical protein n=1 Tax=Streptomyces mirabilis TaxID=68239 RepID=UPI002E1FF613